MNVKVAGPILDRGPITTSIDYSIHDRKYYLCI